MLGQGFSKAFWQKYFVWVHEDDEFYSIRNGLSLYYEQIWSEETRHLNPSQSRAAITEFWTDWKEALINKFPVLHSHFLSSGDLIIVENYFAALSTQRNISFNFIKELEIQFPLEKSILLILEVVESLTIILNNNLEYEWYLVETTFYFSKPTRDRIIDITKNIDTDLHKKLIQIANTRCQKDGRSHFR